MEPEWMKAITNTTVCNFFYFWFVFYAILLILAIITTIGSVFVAKKLGWAGVALSAQAIITSLLAGSFAMFYYIICDRALLIKATEAFTTRR